MREEASTPIVVRLALDDAVLADRLVALLADVPGLRLGTSDEPADVALVAADTLEPATVPLAPDAEPVLTPREQEVLALMAEGASNKAIARRLAISVHTAKFHVGSLLDKLDATGRTDAVAHAARIGMLHL